LVFPLSEVLTTGQGKIVLLSLSLENLFPETGYFQITIPGKVNQKEAFQLISDKNYL
jgi:hypothetical protein